MNIKSPETGSVVKSVRGRDEGKFYIVSEVKGNRIALTDGKVKKLSNPKTKNVKHVKILPLCVDFPKDGAYDCKVAYYLKNLTGSCDGVKADAADK